MASDFIFLHGAVQAAWVWNETIAALQGIGRDGVGRCLTLEVPGCGAKRGRDTGAMTFDELVADLVADIDAWGLSGAVLVGHSQAGSVLPRLIEARPEAFRQAIYISCVAAAPGDTVGFGAPKPAEGSAPPDVREVARTLFCNDMDAAQFDAFIGQVGRDMWPASSYAETGWRYDHLAGFPATFVVCLQDVCAPPDRQREFARRLQVQRVVEIDAAHQAQNSRPEALARILLDEAWLGEHA